MNSLSRIEEAFDKKFPFNLGAVFMDGSDPTRKFIKSFYRHQILALIEENQAEIFEFWEDAIRFSLMEGDKTLEKKVMEKWLKSAKEHFKTILDNYKKEVKK